MGQPALKPVGRSCFRRFIRWSPRFPTGSNLSCSRCPSATASLFTGTSRTSRIYRRLRLKRGWTRCWISCFNGTTTLDRLAFRKPWMKLPQKSRREPLLRCKCSQSISNVGRSRWRTMSCTRLCRANPSKIVRTQVAGTVAGQLQSPDHLAKQALKELYSPPMTLPCGRPR